MYSNLNFLLKSFLLSFLLCLIVQPAAFAQTLKSAMAAAYIGNPTIQAERAALRATDEGVAGARSGYRPNIQANASATSQRTDTSPSVASTEGHLLQRQFGLTVTQPIFRGFRTVNTERKANKAVLAGRAQLKNIEQNILLQTATSYMDVVRDQATLRVTKVNADVLNKQLNSAKNRFEVGEVTSTDVAQARARYNRALSDISLAQANLKTSQSKYQLSVGRLPRGHLSEPPSIESYLPRSLGDSLRRGAAENPQILAAIYQEQASRHDIDIVRGETLPEVNFQANYSRSLDPSQSIEETDVTSFKGTVNIPLYQGGEVSSRVRRAKQTNTQRQLQIDIARRQVHTDIVTAWGQLQSARAQIRSGQVAVNASRTALNGVREEEKVGQRTVLDTLDAEQELLDAEVALIKSKRDFVVAAFSLLAGTGRLTVVDLNVPVAKYDPSIHLDAVKNKWRGFDTPGAYID